MMDINSWVASHQLGFTQKSCTLLKTTKTTTVSMQKSLTLNVSYGPKWLLLISDIFTLHINCQLSPERWLPMLAWHHCHLVRLNTGCSSVFGLYIFLCVAMLSDQQTSLYCQSFLSFFAIVTSFSRTGCCWGSIQIVLTVESLNTAALFG